MNRFLKNQLCFGIAAFLFSAVAPAYAGQQTIRSADSAIWGSAGGMFFNYKEPSPPPDLPDSEHGWLGSVAGGASYLTNQDLYLAVEGSVAYGHAHYNGSFFDDPTVPVQGLTKETISTVDGKIGQGFPLGNNVLLIPYVELGFRYWDRNLGDDQVEDYRNFDALGGLMVQVSPINRLVLSAYGSAGTTFGAQAKADPDTFHLGSDAMYKFGGKIGYDLTQRVEIFTTTDYDYFHYDQSGVVDDAFEPNSNTGETAVRVGLSYHFR